ncbi:diguanylate cyclase [Desulfobulbus sp. AH-315-M07]|nr:diguanylate cyclase [Desulfobulbus sp. AH-315-M07]
MRAEGSGARVLVVDDESDVRQVVCLRLKQEGFRVAECDGGASALALIAEQCFDVVVLDVLMPHVNGIEVLERLAAADGVGPSVIVLSARVDLETRVTSLEVGAVDYIAKPFEASELIARIRVAIRQREALQDAISVSLEDSLTKLGNRRAFEQCIKAEMARALRHERPLSLVMIDADNLKTINDTYGHATGDKLLVAIADAIRTTLRISDHAARIGGDEFALVLPETTIEAARIVVRRLETCLQETQLVDGVFPRASMGVAAVPTDANNVDDLKRVADIALYEVKRSRPASRRPPDLS